MGFSDPAIINPSSVTNTEIATNAAIDPDKFDKTSLLVTNWLHFLDGNNCTDTAPANTTLTRSLSNGTIELSIQAAAATIQTIQKELIAPTALSRIMVFRFSAISGLDANGQVYIGFVDNAFSDLAVIAWDGTNWRTWTFHAGLTSNIITAPAAGDVFIIYLTNGRASFYKNNVHLFTHTTSLPINAVGYGFQVLTGGIASPDVKLDKVSIE